MAHKKTAEQETVKKRLIIAGIVIATLILLMSGNLRNFLTGSLIIPQVFEGGKQEIYTDENGEIFLSSSGITLQIPHYYGLQLQEKNVKQNIRKYKFIQQNTNLTPTLHEIEFFTASNIEHFFKFCEDSICYFSNHNNLNQYKNDYNIENNNLWNKGSQTSFKLKNGEYITNTTPCLTEKNCVLKRYRTYRDKTRIDLTIRLRDKSENEEANQLIEEIGIY